MAKCRVVLEGSATATLDIETDATDSEEIVEEALQEGVPGICAQCSGWGRDHSIELNDGWEPVRDSADKLVVYPLDSDG